MGILYFISLNETGFTTEKRICSVFSFIKENVKLQLFFFRENIVEREHCQTKLLHLFDEN